MFSRWHQGRDKLDKKGRQRRERAGPSPLQTLQTSAACLGSGTPTEHLFRVSGSLGLRSLPSLTGRLVATAWAPTPPRGLEGP